jgi:secreted PhoX family phosphatase
VPNAPGRLSEGGRLQALGLVDGRDSSRNWTQQSFVAHRPASVRWIDLTDTDSPEDDLRMRGYTAGALLFARGEGIHMGAGELYFTCTSGGAAKLGQVFRYRPASGGGTLELFFESSSPDQFQSGDNLTVAPTGDLFVCEDKRDAGFNFIRGITPAGGAYPFARLRMPSELAGVCFSPDGRTMFVNAYRPTTTFAITGPWARG